MRNFSPKQGQHCARFEKAGVHCVSGYTLHNNGQPLFVLPSAPPSCITKRPANSREDTTDNEVSKKSPSVAARHLASYQSDLQMTFCILLYTSSSILSVTCHPVEQTLFTNSKTCSGSRTRTSTPFLAFVVDTLLFINRAGRTRSLAGNLPHIHTRVHICLKQRSLKARRPEPVWAQGIFENKPRKLRPAIRPSLVFRF